MRCAKHNGIFEKGFARLSTTTVYGVSIVECSPYQVNCVTSKFVGENMKIYFVYKGRNSPSGGHKHIRLMVSLLCELGVEAKLLLNGMTADDHFYQGQTAVANFDIHSAKKNLKEDDIVIFPEACISSYTDQIEQWNCRKGVYNQNGFYALTYSLPGGYYRHGIEFVIANAPYVGSITQHYLGMPPNRIFQVPYWIVRGPFERNAPELTSRPHVICYMPRKLPDHIARVKELLGAIGNGFEWVALDGIDENEVARCMQSCQIFLSTQDQEGFGLPSLEAMSCGALVIGYPGTGFFDGYPLKAGHLHGS